MVLNHAKTMNGGALLQNIQHAQLEHNYLDEPITQTTSGVEVHKDLLVYIENFGIDLT